MAMMIVETGVLLLARWNPITVARESLHSV